MRTLIVTGPTAVGKSSLALELAKNIPAEIINADVGQFYTPCTIGTAKPAWKMEPVAHHLFDCIDTPESLSVVTYRARVASLIAQCAKRGNLAIIVGGSGFYLHSLFFPPRSKPIGQIPSFEGQTTKDLWARLAAIDPVRATHINSGDRYRIARALALCDQGARPSDCHPIFQPLAPTLIAVMSRNRKDLYHDINMRTQQMINDGWIEEVRALSPEWRDFLKHKKLIGYNDIVTYLESSHNLQHLTHASPGTHLTEIIARKTRNYAKRQLCFFTRMSRMLSAYEHKGVEVAWFEADRYTNAQLITQLLMKLRQDERVSV